MKTLAVLTLTAVAATGDGNLSALMRMRGLRDILLSRGPAARFWRKLRRLARVRRRRPEAA